MYGKDIEQNEHDDNNGDKRELMQGKGNKKRWSRS
jgi:hypothetical protein